jgi:1,4-alpha-glucan branching enzyme
MSRVRGVGLMGGTRAGVAALSMFVALGIAGCAGGWRNGAPPGASESASTASATTTASGGSTSATADGATFVWSGGGNEVFVAGEFNQWNPTAEKMTKDGGKWKLTKALPPGRYAYKFVVDGTWKEDPNAKESTDDGMGGKNSVVVVTGSASATTAEPGTAATAPGSAATGAAKPPQVTAEGVRFTFAGAAQSVALAGDFNQWAINADPMVRQADGTWTIVKSLPPGRYAYKFVVNGTVWKHDDANPESADDGLGGKNSIVEVK